MRPPRVVTVQDSTGGPGRPASSGNAGLPHTDAPLPCVADADTNVPHVPITAATADPDKSLAVHSPWHYLLFLPCSLLFEGPQHLIRQERQLLPLCRQAPHPQGSAVVQAQPTLGDVQWLHLRALPLASWPHFFPGPRPPHDQAHHGGPKYFPTSPKTYGHSSRTFAAEFSLILREPQCAIIWWRSSTC